MKIFYSFYKINKIANKQKYLNNLSKFTSYNLLLNYNNGGNIVYMNNTNIFMKNGLKKKIKNVFFDYFKYFFFFLNKTDISSNKYTYLNEIKSAISDNYGLRNFNNLFQWYFNYFNFMFNIKNKINPTKSIKKKNINKNNAIKLVFVIKNKRNLYFFKWLKKLFFLNYTNNLKKTIYFLLNDVFLNFKNSQMYKYKISMYKTFLLS